MCGIAGCRLRTGMPTPALLDSMTAALAHRGPDGSGRYSHGNTGLVHVRLSIIDLGGGAQPLYNEDASLTLIANGEIYNYIELRVELEQRGHRFKTHSDCETILHAYEEYGQDFLQHLHGMFAFALYDSRNNSLLLARDRLGIKPLFFTQQSTGFYFGSEIKALLPFLDSKEVNPGALAQFLQINFSSGRDTLLNGVHRLLPGETMLINDNGLHFNRYWTPFNVTPTALSFAQAEEQFDSLITQVMHEHMRTDVPFGLFLSGGVDSSVLLALLARESKEPIRTFSVGFPDSRVHNELNAAAEMASLFCTHHTTLQLDRNTLLSHLAHSVWAADELMGDYANLPVSALAERTGQELKVVFSGEGGDEVFAGYGRYRTHGLKQVIRWLRAPSTAGYRGRGMLAGEENLCSGPLEQALGHWRRPIIEAWQAAAPGWSRLQKMQATDIATWLPDDLLVKADRLLMAWGVEGRVPFLDHRVVEFGLSLPDHLKVDQNNGKLLLKHWAERMLPKQHLWRKKSGFTVPVDDWLSGNLLDQIYVALNRNSGVKQWFNADALQDLVQSQRQHGRHSQLLWAVIQFAIWHRMFIEGDGSRPPLKSDFLDHIAS